MALRNIFSFIIFLKIVSVTKTSFIQLNNGSYEDIVIAIHPGLQEDDTLIQKIEEMVKEASVYLFHATENRLSIKDVKILIPSNWTSKNNYVARTRETYETADVIISDPFLKNGDSPYTVQYRGCGEQGERIHLTPNYLLNTSLSSVYGPPGRTFVHEWAHFRWGVFDEFNDEIPYYISRERKVEATRCSAGIKGNSTMQECKDDVCPLRDCTIDSNTGLYEQGCLFLPEKVQSGQESIMYYSGLPSTTFFCNDSSHNIEAPTLQNRMCNSYSTWDVIMNSTDITSTSPRPDSSLLVPTITLIQSKRRVITLACDVSRSMENSDRIGRLFQGAEFFLTQIVETGTYVGIVEFSFLARANSKLVQVKNEEDRKNLTSLVPSTTENDSGNLCRGILEAINVNKVLDGSAAGTEMLLVTDGDLYYTNCIGDITASGAIIHLLALGSDVPKDLEAFANLTGGQAHFVSDVPSANDMINAFSAIYNQNGDVTQQPILLESRSANLESEACLNGTIFIDSTVGTSTFFLVTWQAAVPSIYLQDPNGNTYNEDRFTNNTRSKSSRLQILGKAEIGAWNYTLCNRLLTNQVVGMIVTSKSAAEDEPPITVKVHVNKDTNDYRDPMIIYASVRRGLLPVTNLNVTAFVTPESGNTVSVQLLDNGAGADVFKNDGVYSRYFTSFSENGRYNLVVQVESQETETRLVLPKHRALYIPGYMENGVKSMNPPKPTFSESDLHITGVRISRKASGGSFIVNNVPTPPQEINYRPCKILDLEAKAQGDSIVLSWTATGDNLDKGQAAQYDLRLSTNPRDLRDSFKRSAPVDISSLTPQLFGSLETFTFVPNNMTEDGVIVLYFALTAINKNNEESDISNIAQTVIPVRIIIESSTIPQSTSLTTPANNNDSTVSSTPSTISKTVPTNNNDSTVSSTPSTISKTVPANNNGSTVSSTISSISKTVPADNNGSTVSSTISSISKTVPANNNGSIVSSTPSTISKTIPSTTFTTPPNRYTTTTTDNSAKLTHTTTGNTSITSPSASTNSSNINSEIELFVILRKLVRKFTMDT
ncbi:calcium-activated chloride channel regulator 1-like [Leptodactylus fuscus]